MMSAETVPKTPRANVIHLAVRSSLALSVFASERKSVVTAVAMECMLESRLDMAAANTPAITSPASPGGIVWKMKCGKI